MEYHKIQKSAGSQRERRGVRNSQKIYLCNKVEASRQSRESVKNNSCIDR